jgi:hypothetical protein
MLRISKAPADVIWGIEESCGVGVGTVDQVHVRGGDHDMLKPPEKPPTPNP